MLSFKQSTFAIAVAIVIYHNFIKSRVDVKKAITGNRVIITGASSGLGEQLAYEYARNGAQIIITARRIEELQMVADECRKLGAQKVDIVVADMSKAKDRDILFQAIETQFAGVLDYLILNHASFRLNHWMGSSQNMTHLKKTLDINFISYVDLSSRCIPLLKKSSRGHIGVISGVVDRMPSPRLCTHSASKAALSAFFAAWRQELRRANVDVSITLCILGLIDTSSSISQVQFINTPNFVKRFAVSSQDTARAVVQSVANRDYYLFYPSVTLPAVLTLNHWFPGMVEDFWGYVVIP